MAEGGPHVAMVAGEASGDLLASLLIRGLHRRWPGLALAGIGGPRMTELGFDAWWPQHRLAVRGYVEVLRHWPGLALLRRRLGDRLLGRPPQVFVGVDAPDFNLGLERRLRERGVRTVHFVCPSIWAWRGGRVEAIARACDHVLCLFPFEPALLQRHGVAATFVGHPLADAIPLEVPRAQARAALGLAADDQVLAVLPGSRRSEITWNGPPFLEAVARLHAERPDLRIVLPIAPGLREAVEAQVAELCPAVPVRLVDGRSHEALAACDATLIASGTATLEAALFKRPMVIGYRMHPLSWQLMKRMRYQPWVGLPNILAGEFLVPERIQEACTPLALAAATRAALDDRAGARHLAERFTTIHHSLRRDTARQAADALAPFVQA